MINFICPNPKTLGRLSVGDIVEYMGPNHFMYRAEVCEVNSETNEFKLKNKKPKGILVKKQDAPYRKQNP